MFTISAYQIFVGGLFATATLIATAHAAEPMKFPPVDELPDSEELPPALVMRDGTPVQTADQWRTKRRPELIALFQHYMYGVAPPSPGITATVTKTASGLLGGKGALKEIEIKVNGLPENAPRIHLAVIYPAAAKGPVPVFLGINSGGNQEVVDSPEITMNPTAWYEKNQVPQDKDRGAKRDFWCVEQLLDRGYAFATFHQTDMDGDKHDWTDGIHPYYKDLPGSKESHWGTIAAWAWGFSRCIDYLVTDPAINKECIAVIGHSRRGKTALLAGALDERIALVVPHQSGTGGMALSRNNKQETVERINRVFPHWFNDNFVKFNDREAKLPIDQHLLVALVAPRALLDTEGDKDKWANFDAALHGLQEADKVWKLLGAPGIAGEPVATAETKLNSDAVGNLVQYRLDSPHTLHKEYWSGILDFADKQFSRK